MTSVEPAGSSPEPLWAKGVIEQNYRWLLAYAYAGLGDEHLAHDLVQEVFQIAYQKRQDYRAEYPLGAWLRGIARNLLRRASEKKPRSLRVVGDEILERLEADAEGLEQAHVVEGYEESRLSALQHCLGKLGDRARSLLEDRYTQNLSLKELSRKAGVSLTGVAMAIYRARLAVGDCVRKQLARGLES